VDALGMSGEEGAGLTRVIADGDDVIKILADKFLGRLGAVRRDVDANLAHRLDGFRPYLARIDAGAFYFKHTSSVVL
jgi:hypothetical protein